MCVCMCVLACMCMPTSLCFVQPKLYISIFIFIYVYIYIYKVTTEIILYKPICTILHRNVCAYAYTYLWMSSEVVCIAMDLVRVYCRRFDCPLTSITCRHWLGILTDHGVSQSLIWHDCTVKCEKIPKDNVVNQTGIISFVWEKDHVLITYF